MKCDCQYQQCQRKVLNVKGVLNPVRTLWNSWCLHTQISKLRTDLKSWELADFQTLKPLYDALPLISGIWWGESDLDDSQTAAINKW